MTSSPRPNPKKRKKANLAAVAEYVGVSRTSVSNAYNNPEHLSEATRQKIFDAARKLGYPGPDPIARQMRTGRTDAIGVVFTDKLTYAFEDRASLDFLAGLAQACQNLESSLTLIPLAPGTAEAGLDLVAQAAVDGFIVYSVSADDPTLDVIRSRALPTVICDQPHRPEQTSDRIPKEEAWLHQLFSEAAFVGIDDRSAIRAGIQQIVDAGHSNIGVLCIRLDREQSTGYVTPERLASAQMHVQRDRVLGILDVIRGARESGQISMSTLVATEDAPLVEGVPVVECYINDHEGTRQAARKLLDTYPEVTAIACTTDSLALAAWDVASDRGRSIPQHLSITGFDGIDEALRRKLTTVVQPNITKGRTAGAVLQNLISQAQGKEKEGAEEIAMTTLLDTWLVAGDTIAGPSM